MAKTINRRLAELIDGNGQLTAGKLPNDFITTAHYSANSITDAKLHTSFSLPASALTARDTGDLSEGSNLYYTDARVGTYISGDRSYGNITTTGYIAGPATFTIDPAAVGDNTGTVVIAGNLQVDGTTTTINSTTMEVDDLNITLASGAANSAAAHGAGITVDGASATLLWSSSDDRFNFNKSVGVSGTLRAAGVDSTNSNYSGIFRNSSGQNIMLMRNDGVVLMQQSYLFVNNSDGIYSDGSIKARGGILNDQGDLALNDNVNVTGNLDVTGNLTVDHGNWTGAPVINVSTDQFDAGASFATGSFILFGEHDGTKDKMLSLKKNSSDIFSVNSSGRLGIGTGDASADLHLNVANAEIRLQHAGNSYFQRIFTDSNNKLHFGTGANGAIQMSVETNALEFAATTTHAALGNVLISIPDRQASLYNVGDRGNITIQASSATTGNQAMSGGRVLINAGNSNNGQSGDVIISSGSNIINANDSGKIRFNIGGRTSSEEAMRIHSNGNVGIGVDNPGARLELDNPSSFTNMIEYGNVTWNQNTGHGLVAVNRGSDGYVQLQLTSGVDNADVFTIRNSGTGADVQHNFLSNGNVYHAGSVGIGATATNPSAKLEINTGSIKVVNSGTDAYFFEGVRSGGNVTLRMYDNSNNLYIDSYNSMNFRANQNGGSGGAFTFTGGNVGMGVGAPNDILDIRKANSQLRLTDTDDNKFVQFSYSGGKLITRNNSTNTTVAQVTLIENGKFGIGTINPTAPLDVSREIGSDIAQTSTHGYSSNRNWAMRTNNYGSSNWGGWVLEQSTSAGGTPSVARIGVHLNGNVGINMGGDASTSLTDKNPATALHVGGDITVGSADTVGTGAASAIRFVNDNERSRITSNYASGGGGQMGFWTDTAGGTLLQRAYIKNDGEFNLQHGLRLHGYSWTNSDVLKSYRIDGPGSSTLTRTINISTYWGFPAQGGAFMYMLHGWQGDSAMGMVHWSNAGNNNQVIVGVYHNELVKTGLTSITVAKGSGDMEIDITLAGTHTNTHGWYWKVWA